MAGRLSTRASKLRSRLRVGRNGRGAAAAVVVDEVAPAGATPVGGEGDWVLEAQLDEPRAGSVHPGFAVAVRGWALGREAPVEAIELVVDGTTVRRLPVAHERPDAARPEEAVAWAAVSGFDGLVGVLDLPRLFDATLEAVWPDGRRRALWSMRGRRLPAAPRARDGIQPLVVRALGRTGSTWLTRLLGSHPEVVAYRPFEYEARLLSYWIELLRAAGDPDSNVGALRPPDLHDRRWWLGGEAVAALPSGDERLHAIVGHEAVRRLAAVGFDQVQAFYAVLGRREGKRARYFVEKSVGGPADHPALWRLTTEIYAGARRLFLVRDPRDAVCSMLAYDERRGRVGFRRETFASEEEWIRWLADASEAMVRDYRAAGDDASLVRYEDLVRQPRPVLSAIFSDLGLAAEPATVDEVLERASVEHPAMAFHRTSGADPEASIGRWQKDMPPRLREATRTAFAEVLPALGYDDET